MSATHTSAGSCHCGAIQVALELSKPAQDFTVRTCTCSFCTRRGTRMISDPRGKAFLTLERGSVFHYRFGTNSCDFLLCQRCGAFAAAVMEDASSNLAVVNTRGLGLTAFDGSASTAMEFGGEDIVQRLERRRANWTPAEVCWRGGT